MRDVTRWRASIPEVGGTYCQGIASSVAKLYEALIKRAVANRIATGDLDLASLLSTIDYGGNATSVERLPLGTVTDLLLLIADQNAELPSRAHGDADIRRAMKRIVGVRNRATHELPGAMMRAVTIELLDLVEGLLQDSAVIRMLR